MDVLTTALPRLAVFVRLSAFWAGHFAVHAYSPVVLLREIRKNAGFPTRLRDGLYLWFRVLVVVWVTVGARVMVGVGLVRC